MSFLGKLFGKQGKPAEPQAGADGTATLAGLAEIPLEGFDDPGKAIRFGYTVILVGLGLFTLWAIFAPIDEGVPAQGVVVVESRRKVISHLTGGTVASVHAQENQAVQENSVLIVLDATRSQTALDTLLNEYAAAAVKLARLMAEQSGSAQIDYPEDLRQLIAQLGRKDLFIGQEQLFHVRQQALGSEQSILREGLAASQIQASGARQQLVARTQQATLLRQEIASNRQLVEEGYAPRNRLLEQERQLAEISSSTSDLQTRVAREGSASAEIRLRLLQRRQEFLKEVETQAADVRRELANLNERIKDARADLDRTIVRAPASGHVLAMAPLATGTVVTPGMKLLEIVPDGDRLLLDAQLPVSVINRVHAGLETDIRITSFPDLPNLVLPGRLLSISSDRHEPPTGQPPYYLARVEVLPAGMAKLGGRQLRPGMSADVVIKTGERSFMAYLMSPITRQLFSAFKEP
jgi:protease secretion system membrane fusion protein